jgi:hypothetical protein
MDLTARIRVDAPTAYPTGRVAGAWVEFEAPDPEYGGYGFWARPDGADYVHVEFIDSDSGAPTSDDLDVALLLDFLPPGSDL